MSSSRASRLGALAWLLAVQFFVVQVIVATAWAMPFSLATRYISDLGNTACGAYPAGSRVVVCSPWHPWMNASFMTIGVTMALGALLTRRRFATGWTREIAALLFVLAGLGVIMVGLYPENVNGERHEFGAGVNFLCGNVALMLFGLAFRSRGRLSTFSMVSVGAGVLGLAGVFLFVSDTFLGLGAGGMERVAAYPMAVWQILAGIQLSLRGFDGDDVA